MDTLEKIYANFNSQDYFHKLRDKFFQNFIQKGGFPNKKNEKYKYIDLRKKFDQYIEKGNYKVLNFEYEQKGSLHNANVLHVTFLNSNDNKLNIENKNHSPISKKLNDINDLNPLENFNLAFISNPLYIKIPNDTDEIVILNNKILSDNGLFMPNIFIDIGENSNVKIVSRLSENNIDCQLLNSFITINISKNSFLELIDIQDPSNLNINNYLINLDKRSKLNSYSITGSNNAYSKKKNELRNDIKVNLNGEFSEANLYGIYNVNSGSKVDNNLEIRHLMPNTKSNQLFKGIISDTSTGIFTGKIYVKENAQKTEAYQLNKAILMSPNSTVKTRPQLEIYADDVKCSHGATVGQLVDEQLLYLQSRGISRDKAQAILQNSFILEIIETIKDESLRNEIRHRLLLDIS